jgi:uncharacterized protein YgbK (DUF1537 family)
MKKFAITSATVASLAFAAVCLASAASAVPSGGSTAADVVDELEAEGYHVQLNGPGLPAVGGLDREDRAAHRERWHVLHLTRREVLPS